VPSSLGKGADLRKGLQELKRRKFEYLAVESELRLLERCQQSELSYLEQNQDRERARIEAKNALRELKQQVEKENEAKQELYGEIARLVAEHEEAHGRCTDDLLEAQQLHAAMEEDEEDAQASGSLLPARMEPDVTPLEAQSLAGLAAAQVEEESKRLRQEFSAECLRKTLSDAEKCREKLERLEWEERAKVAELESHADLDEEFGLGLPRITFDDSAGTVTLGWPPRIAAPSNDNIAARTVSVEFDEQGRLVRADTHPSLELSAEAKQSVETDDLARLLTLVWDRICQYAEGTDLPPAEARDLGGA